MKQSELIKQLQAENTAILEYIDTLLQRIEILEEHANIMIDVVSKHIEEHIQ